MKRLLICFLMIWALVQMMEGMGYANGVIRDSIGTISSGRGGTNLAASDNSALIYDNPSALSRMSGLNWELTMDLLSTNIEYKDPQNDKKAKDRILALPALAGTYKSKESRLAFGLRVFYPAGFAAEYDLIHGGDSPIYGVQTYKSQVSLLKVMPAVAWQVTDKLFLGTAIGPAFQSTGLDMPFTFQTGSLAGTPALINLKTSGTGYTWNLGLQYKFSEKLTLGAAYISKTDVTLKGDMDVDVTGHPVLEPLLTSLGAESTANYDLEMDFKWPQTIGGGVVYEPNPRHRFLMDVQWYQWASAFDDIQLKLSNGNNAGFNALQGGSSSLVDTLPLNWENSYAFKLGYEYHREKSTFQTGYIYNKNPVPNNTLTPLIPGILEHALSLGYDHKGQHWILSTAYQYSFGPKESVGTSKIIGGDFDNSTMEVNAHWIFFNLMYTY
ncbi:MAG: outer membrane protein transport protein [Nitrospirae bacterium]|nr:outer membrane protein transport protein [Nitrospirota bacterium]